MLALFAIAIIVVLIFPKSALVAIGAAQLVIGRTPSEMRENRYGPIPSWTKR